jgi:hypothetical protein
MLAQDFISGCKLLYGLYLVHATNKGLLAFRYIEKRVFLNFSRQFTQNCDVFAHGARHLLELGIVCNELLDVTNAVDVLYQKANSE